MYDREAVNHGAGEYAKEAHANAVENFRAMLKRVRKGAFRKVRQKRLHRCAKEFAGRRTIRNLDAIR